MYEFIVLGLIPGTNIQIGFSFWLLVTSCLCFVAISRRLYRSVWLRQTSVAYRLALEFKRADDLI